MELIVNALLSAPSRLSSRCLRAPPAVHSSPGGCRAPRHLNVSWTLFANLCLSALCANEMRGACQERPGATGACRALLLLVLFALLRLAAAQEASEDRSSKRLEAILAGVESSGAVGTGRALLAALNATAGSTANQLIAVTGRGCMAGGRVVVGRVGTDHLVGGAAASAAAATSPQGPHIFTAPPARESVDHTRPIPSSPTPPCSRHHPDPRRPPRLRARAAHRWRQPNAGAGGRVDRSRPAPTALGLGRRCRCPSPPRGAHVCGLRA